MLIQLARKLTGLTVIATASRPETIEWCRELGAHHVIDHRQPLSSGLQNVGITAVRFIASLTQTDTHYPELVRALAPQGRLALIDDPKALDVIPLKAKSASLHWESMFTRSMFETPDMIAQHELLDEVAGLVDAGILRSTLRQTRGLITAGNLIEAHRVVESGTSIGKTVLEGWP